VHFAFLITGERPTMVVLIDWQCMNCTISFKLINFLTELKIIIIFTSGKQNNTGNNERFHFWENFKALHKWNWKIAAENSWFYSLLVITKTSLVIKEFIEINFVLFRGQLLFLLQK
jgi:hypothetical protein